MRKPLDNWDNLKRTYRHGAPTTYSLRHFGVDYAVPIGTPIYAPFDGSNIVAQSFLKGGNTLWFKFENKIMRCMHLRDLPTTGIYKEGDVIGYTGNTGSLTTGPHLHLDISKNNVDLTNFYNFLDPDKFFNDMIKFKVVYINDWIDNQMQAALETVNVKLQEFSNGKLGLEIVGFIQKNIEHLDGTNFTTDEVNEVLKQIQIQIGDDVDWVIIFYKGNMLRPWTYTVLFEDILAVPYTVFPKNFGEMTNTLLFECGHALIQCYNFRKEPTTPSISNLDNYSGGEQYVKDKVQAILSRLDLYEKSNVSLKPKYVFNTDLFYGQKNSNDVKNLQKALKYLDLFPYTIVETGNYYGVTANSVLAFQKKYNVASFWELLFLKGRKVGPKTRAKLNQIFS